MSGGAEGLHRIGPRGVTTPFELDPFMRQLTYYMTISLEKLSAIVERFHAQMRELHAATSEVQRAFALLAEPLKALER